MSACTIHPVSADARDKSRICGDTAFKHAKALGFRFEQHGDGGECGWDHPLLDDPMNLYASRLDCCWTAIQALADHLADDGFVGRAGARAAA